MITITKKKAYKLNCINIAKHHKKCCDGEDCNISLILLSEMLRELGIKISKKELEVFV